MGEFCPQCGAARVGAFRFCRSCRFDFDAVDPGPAVLEVASELRPSLEPPSANSSAGRLSSKRAKVGVATAVFLGLAAIGSTMNPAPSSPAAAIGTPVPSALVAVASSTSTPAPTTSPEPTFGPTSPTTEATVERVIDGDTIVVAYGGQEYHVRYIGMDTPETKDPNTALQWMGPQATAANEALVAGQTVYLEKDVSETDQFDRLLRYVWLTDGATWTLVNLELVRQGVAIAKSYPPDTKFDAVYLEAQGVAQASAVGLWRPTPAPPTAPPTPAPTPVKIVAAPPAPKCHPSYDPCLPITGDLDCPDIRAMGLDPVTVIGPDDYRLDGNHDGVGCE